MAKKADNACPYNDCESDSFENIAVEDKTSKSDNPVWVNQCLTCKRFSLHNENSGKQVKLNNSRRLKG